MLGAVVGQAIGLDTRVRRKADRLGEGEGAARGAGTAHEDRDEMTEHRPHRATGADQEQLAQHHLPTRKWHTSPSCMT